MELTAGTQIGGFVVDGRIGSGGMGAVYRVRDPHRGLVHALKVLTHHHPDVCARLVREARIQASLVHPNVVAVLGLVDIDGYPAILLEHVRGPSLAAVLHRARLSIAQADDVARGILAGVAAAHRHGVVHRDLKPSNVLISLDGAHPVAKVADFGLAKVVVGERPERGMDLRTMTGDLLGTPAYMSPEQIRDARRVGPATDVFALGAILYELVTGEPAFAGETRLDVLNAVDRAVVVPPRDLVPELPRRMERAILGALRADPEERIQTAEVLLGVWEERGATPVGVPTPPHHEVWRDAARGRLAAMVPTPEDTPFPPAARPPRPTPTMALRVVDDAASSDAEPRSARPLRLAILAALCLMAAALSAFASYQLSLPSTASSASVSAARASRPARSDVEVEPAAYVVGGAEDDAAE